MGVDVVKAQVGIAQYDPVQGRAPLAAVGGSLVPGPGGNQEIIGAQADQEIFRSGSEEIAVTEKTAHTVEFGLFPFVLVIGLEGDVAHQVHLAVNRPGGQQDFLHLDAGGVARNEIGAVLQTVDARGEGGLAPIDDLATQPDVVEVIAGQLAAGVHKIVEHFQPVAVLVDGRVGESPEPGGPADGRGVARVIAQEVLRVLVGVLVVDVVVVATGPGEQTIAAPLQVRLSDKRGLVLDQAAIEIVVAVIGVDQYGVPFE